MRFNIDSELLTQSLERLARIITETQTTTLPVIAKVFKMSNVSIEQIETLSNNVLETTIGIQRQLLRVKMNRNKYNDSFATDYNGYFLTVANTIQLVHEKTSPQDDLLEKLLQETNPNKEINQQYNHKYTYEVEALHGYLNNYYKSKKECVDICLDVIKQEEEIKKDPERAKVIFDVCREKEFENLKFIISHIAEEEIGKQKKINSCYKQYSKYDTEEEFAAAEFHKHNKEDFKWFCIIQYYDKNKEFTDKELEIFNNNAENIRKAKKAAANFDKLLPKNFTTQRLGEYQYMFCKLVAPINIEAACNFLSAYYKGKYDLRKYAAVNRHSKDFYKKNNDVSVFADNLKRLFGISIDNKPAIAVAN